MSSNILQFNKKPKPKTNASVKRVINEVTQEMHNTKAIIVVELNRNNQATVLYSKMKLTDLAFLLSYANKKVLEQL